MTQNIPVELAGFGSSSDPFLAHTQSNRQGMNTSQYRQAVHTDGTEQPLIISGKEYEFSLMEFQPTLVEEPSTILTVIPKMINTAAGGGIYSYTVMYYVNRTKEVKCFNIEPYTLLNHGKDFGYKNELINRHLLQHGLGSHMEPGTAFTVSPAIHDGLYCISVNANVLHCSDAAVGNDSFKIADTFAKKLETPGFSRYVISLSPEDIPLNTHGDLSYYRILPEINDPVKNNILFAYRTANMVSYSSDLSREALQKINHLHDKKFICPEGSKIVDIKVFINPARIRELKSSSKSDIKSDEKYGQILEIHNMYTSYYRKVIDEYNKIKELGLVVSPELNALVVKAMGTLRIKKHTYKDTQIEFINMEIVITYPRSVNSGNKLTGRDACKGVIGSDSIIPEANMPITESGVRADMIIADKAPFNRMTTGDGFYGTFINHASEVIRKRINDGLIGDVAASYQYVLSFKEIISSEDVISMKMVIGDDPIRQKEYIDELKTKPIYHCIPPFSKEINPSIFAKISEKFGIHKEHWSMVHPWTGDTIHSKYPTIIGSKPIMLLGKLPNNDIHAVEFGYLNQFGLPIKEAQEIKQKGFISSTPIRWGVDEICIMTALLPTAVVARWMCVNGNNLEAVKMLQHELLTTEFPTRLFKIPMSTKDMLDGAINISVLKHMLSCCGIVFKAQNKFKSDDVFQPFPVKQHRRKKKLITNDTVPYITDIILPDGQRININAIYEFKAVKYIMDQKLDNGYSTIIFSDNKECRIKTRLLLINMILWDIYLYLYVVPTKEDVFDIKNIDGSMLSGLYTKIYKKLLKHVDDHMYLLERVWVNVNRMNQFNDTYCPAYNTTLCGVDLAETISQPGMIDIRSRIPDMSIGETAAESILRGLTDELVAKILSGEIKSALKPHLEAGVLNVQQVGQVLIAYGTRDDIDSSMPGYLCGESNFEGISTVKSLMLEHLSVAKSMWFNKRSMGTAGYFQKCFRMANESNIEIMNRDCGNRETYEILFKASWKSNFIDRVIIENGNRVILTPDNINKYVNTMIQLVDPTLCNNEFGICEHCAGYGEIGELKSFIIPGSNLGIIASTIVGSVVLQMILSNKHLIKTNAIIYNIPFSATPYFEKSTGGLSWKKNMRDFLKQCSLRIPRASILTSTNDLAEGSNAPDSFSQLDDVQFIHSSGKVIEIYVCDAVTKPFLSQSMLNYIKRIYDRIIIDQDNVTIPLADLDMTAIPFKYNIINYDMSKYVDSVRTFYNKSISKYSGEKTSDVLTDVYDLIYEKTSTPSFYISYIIKSFRTKKTITEHGTVLEFDNMNRLLETRDLPGKLRHEKLGQFLKKPETFVEYRQASPSDVFFNL